jgi:hypothetical protein
MSLENYRVVIEALVLSNYFCEITLEAKNS